MANDGRNYEDVRSYVLSPEREQELINAAESEG